MKKQSKKSIVLLLAAAVLAIGNSAMAQNENNIDSKVIYNDIYNSHNYSVTIKTDKSKATYLGKLNEDMMACNKYVNDTMHNYICQIKDDNTISITRIGLSKVCFEVPGLKSNGKKILFTNIKQNNNVVNFDIEYQDKTIAECSIELPDGKTKFKKLLPLTFNSDNEEHKLLAQKAPYMENIAICIFTEIFDSIKGNISTKYRQCYEHFDVIVQMGMKNGYSYKAHHPKHHDECSFSGMK